MPTETIQALIVGDTITTNGAKFRIVRVTRFSVDVEIESTGAIELNADEHPDVGADSSDPNANGIELAKGV